MMPKDIIDPGSGLPLKRSPNIQPVINYKCWGTYSKTGCDGMSMIKKNKSSSTAPIIIHLVLISYPRSLAFC